MSIRDNIKAFNSARSKAARDISISAMFFDEHNHAPEKGLALQFFRTIGTDITAAEKPTYKWLVSAWQRRYALAHPGVAPAWEKKKGRGLESTPSITVYSIPIQGGVFPETTGDSMLDQIVQAMQAGHARAVKANLLAGKCLSCGGTITPDGECSGEGEVEGYDPTTDTSIDFEGIIQTLVREEEQN